MTTHTDSWTDPAWIAAAHGWIAAAAAQAGQNLAGPIEQIHVRPWSTVLRAPTSAGDWYFKAVAPLPDAQRREQAVNIHHLLREFLAGLAA